MDDLKEAGMRAVATTPAELRMNDACRMMVGFPYGLGWESSPTGQPDKRYDVGEATTPAKKGDCSGDVWAALVYSGVLLDGEPVTKADRHNAQTYWKMATIKLDGPELPGDMPFLFFTSGSRKGEAKHIGIFMGGDEVFQMGDGHGTASIGSVAYWNKRATVKWARIPGLDWGRTHALPVADEKIINISKLPMVMYEARGAKCVDWKTACPDVKIITLSDGTKALKDVGKSGPIRMLQTELTEQGFSTKGIDGIAGKNTNAAIRRFQRAEGLDVDGWVGWRTYTELLA